MDAIIESDTSQNTNSLISCGYFIQNYSEDDSDKENNSTNNIDSILESSEDKVKTLAQRTNGLMLVPFSPRTNILPLSVPLTSTTKISFLSIAFFVMVFYPSLCSTSHISDRVHCSL